MADQLNAEPNIPRVAKKQKYQDNIPASSPEEYYKRALVIPIVNTYISEMTHRFNTFNLKQLNYWFWNHQFYVLKSLKKMLTFYQFSKSMKKIS